MISILLFLFGLLFIVFDSWCKGMDMNTKKEEVKKMKKTKPPQDVLEQQIIQRIEKGRSGSLKVKPHKLRVQYFYWHSNRVPPRNGMGGIRHYHKMGNRRRVIAYVWDHWNNTVYYGYSIYRQPTDPKQRCRYPWKKKEERYTALSRLHKNMNCFYFEPKEDHIEYDLHREIIKKVFHFPENPQT